MKNSSEKFEALLKDAFQEERELPIDLINGTREKLHKREVTELKLNNKKTLKWVASLAAGLMLTTLTAYAAWNLLTSSEVANQFGDESLATAFESPDAIHINETVISEGYIFNLLSIISGEGLTDMPIFINETIQDDRMYAVVAITREDGTSMNDSTSTFFASPYIHGFAPWQVNLATLGAGGHQEVTIDGVLYRLIDMENLEAFADHGVYLGISLGTFSFEAFDFNEDSGAITLNPDFNGPSVLFELPLDVSLANEERALEIIDAIFSEEIDEEETESLESEFVDDWWFDGQEDMTFVRMTYDEFADFLQERIERDIENGEPQAVIQGARRDREGYLQLMRDHNIEFAEVWYNETGMMITFTSPDYAEEIGN